MYNHLDIKTKMTEFIDAILTMMKHWINDEETSYKSALYEVRQYKIRPKLPKIPTTIFLKKDFNVSGLHNIVDADDLWTYRSDDDDVEYEITNIAPTEASEWFIYYRNIKDKPQVPDHLFLSCYYEFILHRAFATKMMSKLDIVYKRKTN